MPDTATKVTIYRVKFQRPADSADPRGSIELEGANFPDLVLEAWEQGYPRVVGGTQRQVTPWVPIEDYAWDTETT